MCNPVLYESVVILTALSCDPADDVPWVHTIQHLSAQFHEAFGLFLCLNCGEYDTISPK